MHWSLPSWTTATRSLQVLAWLPAKPAAVCAECRRSAHLFSSGVRTHNPTVLGPSLVTRTGANPVSVVCSGISLCTWHSTGVSCREPAADIRVRRPSPYARLCRHDYAAGVADSSCNSWKLATAPFRWLRRGRGTVCQHRSGPPAVVFSAADKGPSVSAVVQLTSI